VRGAVPGTAKAPEALREAGLYRRLSAVDAVDAGVVLAGRYLDDDANRPEGHVRNEAALADHCRRLRDRLADVYASGRVPLVLGGDCSIVLAAGLALGPGAGLVHVDGHTDFRNPGNSESCASVAGEDLAAAVGRHWPAVANIDDGGPYFAAATVASIGCREADEHLVEASSVLGSVVTATEAIRRGLQPTAQAAADVAGGAGYWLHLDVDVLDPGWMPAVDSPAEGGLTPDQLVELLAGLAPRAAGASVTVFDPDLDPTGRYAALLVDVLVAGVAALGTQLAG
jgi:arginase